MRDTWVEKKDRDLNRKCRKTASQERGVKAKLSIYRGLKKVLLEARTYQNILTTLEHAENCVPD